MSAGVPNRLCRAPPAVAVDGVRSENRPNSRQRNGTGPVRR